MLKQVQHDECVIEFAKNLQLLNLQLQFQISLLQTFCLNPLIIKKNCSTFAVRFIGYLQRSRGSGN